MIDTHIHGLLGWKKEDIAECIKICKWDKVVLSAIPIDQWACELNDGCAKIIENFPDKIKGLIGINPPDLDESLRRIEKYDKKGFIGIKLMPTSGYYPDDEKFLRIFEEVNARKWITMMHCGWCSKGCREKDLPQSTRFTDPYHIEPLARIFKDIDFILAHGGGRTYFQRAWELTQYHENVYVDTCGGQGPWVFRNGGVWLDILNWKNVLFGTDFRIGSVSDAVNYHQKIELMENIFRETGHSDKEDAVFNGNAARLLKKHNS